MTMQLIEGVTQIDGPVLLQPAVYGDHRGFFHETYRRNVFIELGIREEFVQDNHSRSERGVLRGMHYAVGHGMSKLIRCSRGAIVDVLLDLRKGSPTFGSWQAFELNDDNLHQLYCPIGFAHGFVVVSDVADVIYKCSGYYEGSMEREIAWNDPDVGIQWPEGIEIKTSERDDRAPRLAEIVDELPFVYEPRA